MTDKRPVYLNLLKIRLPTTGIVSFAHRVSGFLLFLAIPFAVYVLDLSVDSPAGFERSLAILQHPVVQLIGLILLWALLHHLLAGIRYLLLDFDFGIEKTASTRTAWTVLAAEVALMAVFIAGVLL